MLFPILLRHKLARDTKPIERELPNYVPWAMLETHGRQAISNHGQTLRRLAARGGLSPCEMIAVLEDRPWSNMTDHEAAAKLIELINKFKNHE